MVSNTIYEQFDSNHFSTQVQWSSCPHHNLVHNTFFKKYMKGHNSHQYSSSLSNRTPLERQWTQCKERTRPLAKPSMPATTTTKHFSMQHWPTTMCTYIQCIQPNTVCIRPRMQNRTQFPICILGNLNQTSFDDDDNECCLNMFTQISTQDSLLVEHPTHDYMKGCEFESWQKRQERLLLHN